MWDGYDPHIIKASMVALMELLKLSDEDVRDIMEAFMMNRHV